MLLLLFSGEPCQYTLRGSADTGYTLRAAAAPPSGDAGGDFPGLPWMPSGGGGGGGYVTRTGADTGYTTRTPASGNAQVCS